MQAEKPTIPFIKDATNRRKFKKYRAQRNRVTALIRRAKKDFASSFGPLQRKTATWLIFSKVVFFALLNGSWFQLHAREILESYEIALLSKWGTCALRHRGRRGRESQCEACLGACLGGIAFCGQFLPFAFQSFRHRSAVFLDKVRHKSEVLVLV